MSQARLKDQPMHVCVPDAVIAIIDIMNLPTSYVIHQQLVARPRRRRWEGCLLAASLQKQDFGSRMTISQTANTAQLRSAGDCRVVQKYAMLRRRNFAGGPGGTQEDEDRPSRQYRRFAPERLLRSEAEAAAPVRPYTSTLQEHCKVAPISALLQSSASSNSFLRLGSSVWHGQMVAGCWVAPCFRITSST